MKRFFLAAALLSLCAFEAPMMYSRVNLPVTIAKPAEGVNARLLFDAEVREASSVARTPGWYNFATLGDANAAMVAYASPTIVEIGRTNDYAPVDIFMLNAYGDIVQIMPGIVPAEMEDIISSPEPIVAVMYLKGGASERFGIAPGDHVEYALFRKRPTVLTAPGKEAVITPAPAAPAPAPTAAPVQPVTIIGGPKAPAKKAEKEKDYLDLLDPRMNTNIKEKKK